MTDTIRVLLVDDHPLVREGIVAVLETATDIDVVGQAADGVAAIELARRVAADVMLLDLMMPRQDGIATIPILARECPDLRILVLTSFVSDEQIATAIESGALGYLLKDTSGDELLRAIRDVAQGELTLHPAVARRLLRAERKPAEPVEDPLTARESEVLALLAEGLSNQEIAARLVMSVRTVGTHVSHILKKLQLASRTQAALFRARGESPDKRSVT